MTRVQPPVLLTIEEASERLRLPAQSLRSAAEAHGYLVRVGRSVRIVESELAEIVEKCRCQPKARASSSENEKAETPSGSSRIRGSQSVARAQQIAEKLKTSSRNTSRGKPGEVVPLDRTK